MSQSVGDFRTRYEEVIASFRWKALRERLIASKGGKCQRCKRYVRPLQLHHKTYERLGEERDDDLEVLCLNCHEIADEERAREGRRRSDSALYSARLNGWASKRYGDDWDSFGEAESIEEEFDDWLDRQDNY